MSRNRYTPEQIISMLREAEVALAQGQSVGQACRTLGVSEQSYYRWRVVSDKNGLMCRWGIHSFTRCKTPSAISTVRQRSSGSR